MLKEKGINYEILTHNVIIECPICSTKKRLKVPIKIINKSKQLTTVSVPIGLVCQHNFQAFLDKNFKVRGYQKVDFEFSKIEFYEGGLESIILELEHEQKLEENFIQISSLPIFMDIIKILRTFVDGEDIIGSALFTLEGKVLYSSLSLKILNNIIKEFEIRNEKDLIQVEKLFLVLTNKQKIFSKFLEIGEYSLIITLIFSKNVQLGLGDLHLREIIKKILKINMSLD